MSAGHKNIPPFIIDGWHALKWDCSHHEHIAGAVGDVDIGGFCLLLVGVHHAELRHLNKQ